MRLDFFCSSATLGRSQRAQSIGVKVKDTSNEIKIATVRVMENSRNKRTIKPPRNKIETNTTTNDSFLDSKVKRTLREASIATCNSSLPLLICRAMFSKTTMALTTNDPETIINAINDRLFSEKYSIY